jgi:ribonuclease D
LSVPRDDRTEPPALEPPEIVASEPALRALVERLQREPEIAVDTEADSFYHYQESVCLIQVTAGARDFLIDPLAGIDLAPFGRVLADPARIKVFHDGEYDVLLLKRQFGFSFANLFDTRVAAAALGVEMPGLASVLAAHFGVELDKSLQRSDWSARPLTSKQIEYARLDTHYLLALMHAQRAELEERERAVVVAGEYQRLENLAAPARAFDPDEFVRLKGARALSLQRMQVLRELFVLRDDLARRRDVPPFKVLGNNLLIEIARRSPRSQR